LSEIVRTSSPWFARATAAALGVLAALAAGELSLRVLGAPEVGPVRRGRLQVSKNPRLRFEPVPGFKASTTSDFEEYLGSGNRLGYRDQDHEEAKPAGVLRVVVLGDSIAAGYRIERFEDTFPGILGRSLSGLGLPVEVLNFGVTGYNTEQQVETLRARALAFEPDIVLVAYCHNDREPPDPRLVAALREAQEKRPVVPENHGRRLLIRSALYRFLRYSAFPPREAGPGNGAAGPGDTVEASLRELAGLARERPFDVLFAVFPVLPHLNDPRYAKDHAELERLSAELGFTHLDLRSAFRACRAQGGKERLGLDLFHPSASGHRCAGEAMALAVEAMIRAAAG